MMKKLSKDSGWDDTLSFDFFCKITKTSGQVGPMLRVRSIWPTSRIDSALACECVVSSPFHGLFSPFVKSGVSSFMGYLS